MQHLGNWHEVLALLEDHLLQGSDALPLPPFISDYFRKLGFPISDDVAEALLEIQAVVYFMRETSLPEKDTTTELPLNEEVVPWTPGELLLIRAVFQTSGQKGLPELAGLLRRCQRTFPEGSLKPLVQALREYPPWFGAVADLFDSRSRTQLKDQEPSAWLFPDGPPELRKLTTNLAHRHMLHWIWQQPEAMLSWVRNNPREISSDWWLSFLEKVGHLLPAHGNELLDVLFPFSGNPQAFPVVRARIVLGNEALREKVAAVWMPMVQLEEGFMRAFLPEMGPQWGDFISFNEEVDTRQTMFLHWGSCLSIDDIANKMGLSISLWCNLAFRSPDSPLWMKVMAEQLRIHPTVEGRLAWLEALLAYPDRAGSGFDVEIMEGLPQDRVSGLLVASLGGNQKITDWDGLVGKILTAPSFYWSATLTDRVAELMRLRPSLLKSALALPGFK